MLTLGLAECLARVPDWMLLAQGDALALADSLAISPIKLAIVLAYFYGCLYVAVRLEDSPAVPNELRTVLQVAALFMGPFVFAGLYFLGMTKPGGMKAPANSPAPAADVPPPQRKPAAARGPGMKTILSTVLLQAQAAVFRLINLRREPEETEEKLRLFDASGADLNEIYGHGDSQSANRHILDLTSRIIDEALQQRASDILIDPLNQTSYAVRFRVDGTLRTARELPMETSRAVINSVKAVSSMDISERRRPQDGAFTARKGEISSSFRVASAGALNGEKLSIRVLNQNAGGFTLADVGIPASQCTVIAGALGKPAGMILVCGPTGSGKTTTLYSMLNQIDRRMRNVITVEDPIEAHLKDVSQLEINAKADITFAKALRSILRQDPDVICVGEIRDEETASIALRAAQTGHLVLATIHCDSNATALIRLLDLGVSPLLLSSGLSLLVSQRLMRKLCEHCARPAQLSEAVVEKLRQSGIDPSNISEAVGCEICGGTGYYGRLAVCDLLSITDDLRAEIANSGTIVTKLRGEGEKKGRASLKSEALRHVIAGITSLDELKRVVG